MIIALVVALLAGAVGGFLAGREFPTEAAVKRYVMNAMAEAFQGTPFGAAVTGTETPGAAGAESAANAAESTPTPIAAGQQGHVNYGGTEDALTFTVTEVTRHSKCPNTEDGYLVVYVDVTTSGVFNQNDMPFSNFSYLDDAGVTHTNPSFYGGESTYDAPASCVDGLPNAYEMKPSSRYTGSVVLDLPADAKTLTFGTAGYGQQKEWTLEVPKP